MYFDLLPVENQHLTTIRRRRGDYKTASHHFANLFLLLHSPVGEYKGMSRQILPVTTSDFLYSHLKNSYFLLILLPNIQSF